MGEKIKQYLISFFRRSGVRVFLVLFAFGLIIFLPSTIFNGFSLPMNGDYVIQQVPFYNNAHDIYWHFIRTGEFTLFNYENFIGVNYFPANTFYYLTSPFSILIIFCPKFLMPQFLFVSMVFKMSLGGYFFYVLLRKYFNISNKNAFLGGLVYAFCGWGMFYLWFNHLADVMAIFPLTLIGAEYLLKKNKGWLLALSMLLMGMTNFFFLFTFAITNSLYIFFRVLQTTRRQGILIKVKKLAKGALCFGVGIALCGIILFPVLSMLGGNPRLDSYGYLIGLMRFFYPSASYNGGFELGKMQSIGKIFYYKNLQDLISYLFRFKDLKHFVNGFSSVFFAPWGDWDTLLYESEYFDNVWSNMYITMPLLALLVPALISSIKERKILDVFLVLGLSLAPFAPIVYNSLHAFSQAYGRWQIFLMALTLIYTIKKLDHIQTLTRIELFAGLTFTVTMMSLGIYLSTSHNFIGDVRLYFAVGSIFYAILIFIFYFTRDFHRFFKQAVIYLVMIELFAVCNIAVQMHGYQNYKTLLGGQNLYNQQEAIMKEMKKDKSWYRTFNVLANRNNVNLPMALGYKGMSTFHSAYEYGLTEFINFARINYSFNNWSMGVHEKRFYLESFLNVKYYIIDNPQNNNITFPNLPIDFEPLYYSKDFYVYENPNHYELGTSYDNFISDENFSFNYYYETGSQTMYRDLNYLRYPIVHKNTVAGEVDDVAELKDELSINTLATPDASANVTYSLSNHQVVYTPYIWDESRYGTSERSNGMPAMTQFNYNDKLDVVLNQTIPANSIINVNLHFGPNMAITLYSTRSEMEQFLASAELTQNQKNKINNTLNHDCHNDFVSGVEYCQVTYDNHMIHWYNKGGDHKYSRGFYSPLTISKMQFKFQENTKLITSLPTYSYSSYNYYLNQMKQNKDNGFSDVRHSNNKISFKTDYQTKRLVLLSIPYNEGWKITVNKEEVKKYKLTSGFLGFIAPAGHSEIKMSYFTPGMSRGIKVSLAAGLLLGAIIVFDERKKIMRLWHDFTSKESK